MTKSLSLRFQGRIWTCGEMGERGKVILIIGRNLTLNSFLLTRRTHQARHVVKIQNHKCNTRRNPKQTDFLKCRQKKRLFSEMQENLGATDSMALSSLVNLVWESISKRQSVDRDDLQNDTKSTKNGRTLESDCRNVLPNPKISRKSVQGRQKCTDVTEPLGSRQKRRDSEVIGDSQVLLTQLKRELQKSKSEETKA